MNHVTDADLAQWSQEARAQAMKLIAELDSEYGVIPEPSWRRVEVLASQLVEAAQRAQAPTTVAHMLRTYSLVPRDGESR